MRYEIFGGANLYDVLVPSDYDGDGKADVAVWRPGSSHSVFYVLPSTTGTPFGVQWGAPTDFPVAADYDGDGKSDLAVWRPSDGVWYILQSYTNTPLGVAWGQSGDVPIPSTYNHY